MAPLAHALFILAHDAAHYRLYETRWLNDLVGRLCGTLAGLSMCTYRVIHRLHHNHLYGPRTRTSRCTAAIRAGGRISRGSSPRTSPGLTAWKTYAYFFGAPAVERRHEHGGAPARRHQPATAAGGPRDRWGVLAFHVIDAGGRLRDRLGLVLRSCSGSSRLRPSCRSSSGSVRSASTARSPTTRHRSLQRAPTCRTGGSATCCSRTTSTTTSSTISTRRCPHYNLPRLHRALNAHGVLEGAEIRRLSETLPRIFADRVAP